MILSKKLFQFGNDGMLRTVEQQLGVSAIAAIEADVAKLIIINGGFAVRRRRLQWAGCLKHHQRVLVVEMHGSRLMQPPRVVPDHDRSVFQQFPHMRTWKRE